MILVFSELGGESLLGKAREIADSLGDRVLALAAKDSIDPQRLIYLGADEVLMADVSELGDWIEIVSDLVMSEKAARLVIFPSNIVANVIMGAVYSHARSKIGYYLDEAVLMEGTSATKSLDATGFLLQKTSREGTGLVSIKVASIPEPFEDVSRYGKSRELELKKPAEVFPILHDLPEEPLSSSSELTILVGDDRFSALAQKLADRYHARMHRYSGAIQVVYGPCMAIELVGKLRDLPEFKGDLISLNAKESPINAISEVSVVNSEIGKILEAL